MGFWFFALVIILSAVFGYFTDNWWNGIILFLFVWIVQIIIKMIREEVI